MRIFIILVLFIISSPSLFAQQLISGIVTDAKTKDPLAFANVSSSESNGTLTNINGSFTLTLGVTDSILKVSYIGYQTRSIDLSKDKKEFQIELAPKAQILETVQISSKENPANKIIQKAIQNKKRNDPTKVLDSYKYKSYNKFLIDNLDQPAKVETDSSNIAINEVVNVGRAYLSEKVSSHVFSKSLDPREIVEGIKTAGFRDPVYDVLALKVEPLSLYGENYTIYKTDYAAPLDDHEAFENYNYKILDTLINKERPAYLIYFKPKRERVVAGLEGVLYIDTTSYAIQKATAQLAGSVKLKIVHEYNYYEDKDLWFPSSQLVTIQPGSGEKDISVFGGSISLGSVQQKRSILNSVLGSGTPQEGLYLESKTINYDLEFNVPVNVKNSDASILVLENAGEHSVNYWAANRKLPFTFKDELTAMKVDSIIQFNNIERKIEVKKGISNGYYPVGLWDFSLKRFIKYNNLQGFRLGVGGKTNNKFSERFSFNGYFIYGTKDGNVKFNAGAGLILDKNSGTELSFNYTDDLNEVASFSYLRGTEAFYLLQPRYGNINEFYRYKKFQINLQHPFSPRFRSEVELSTARINPVIDYTYSSGGDYFEDYQIAEAKLGFSWKPFSNYVSTPEKVQEVRTGYPQFTAQIDKGFSKFLKGDFDYIKFGLKMDYKILRLDQSISEIILEGNYINGNFPITHAFNAYPNNPNKEEIISRVSIAGKMAFETMYFTEFYSDRQISLHLRHQLRPINITDKIQPELVFVSSHALGDFKDQSVHKNIQFNTLNKGYSESGIEINQIFAGFGLSFAYRYGAYHLPTFKENFSFKATFILKI